MPILPFLIAGSSNLLHDEDIFPSKHAIANGEIELRENEICEMHVRSLLRMLSLRDVETEEHTQRVTSITLGFAHFWGFPKQQLIHMCHGAQLHDLGKVGIPDVILHKKDSLTDDEWTVMRMHPIYAYELLHPISYLRPSLDIPYGHHEKWDGTGYPRGLRDRQIPLAARLFAIVDVWDALLSDRPYRKAWTHEKTIAYVREQSGKHFDPNIVRMFGEFMGSIGEFNGVNPFLSLDPLFDRRQNSAIDALAASDD